MQNVNKQQAFARLELLCKEGQPLATLAGYEQSKIVKWKRDVRVAISSIFGPTGAHLQEFEKEITLKSNGPFAEMLSIARALPILQSMRDEVNEWSNDTQTEIPVKNTTWIKLIPQIKRVFVVHGHDEEMKEAVARVVEKLGLEAIILHEQPDKGRTIIEKFTGYTDVCFAVILLSPDDFAYPKTESATKAKLRARQNVILELGYFLGKLDRTRVFILHKDETNFEMPSDYSGVLFTPFDKFGQWKLELVQELQSCGINVDANKLLKK